MATSNSVFWTAFSSREDLAQFGNDALLLFALQLKLSIEDILILASNSLTEGNDDKKADLVHIDAEEGYVVIAQTYVSQDINKKSAPSNKASDLNTAVSWLLNRPIEDLPLSMKPQAEELRQAIKDRTIRSIHIWYVHNLPESKNVRQELATVEHTAKSAIKAHFPESSDIDIQALEVGISTLKEWYQAISTPILVSDEFIIPISGGFDIGYADWKAYVTSIPAKWLYEQFKKHKTKLFSANVRDYLGSRNEDRNINNAIKNTAHDDPKHFWVFNNGITVLVHEFKPKKRRGQTEIWVKGFSIVNGAQTTGSVGNLNKAPSDDAKIQVRFITCNDKDTLRKIVLYNNTQNKITAADFRSSDPVQGKLLSEFKNMPCVEYLPRRGGHEDAIKRRPYGLPSVTAGQALAAFHRDPDIAYHQKTHMWEDDTLYSRYFNEQTTAKHIIFAYSLLQAVEKKKRDLLTKSKNNSLKEIEKTQLNFFRKRGSTFLMASAIARCLEILLDKQIPNLFSLSFRDNLSPEKATDRWTNIIDSASSFTEPLEKGLSDGFKNRDAVEDAIKIFQSLIAATREANKEIYNAFAGMVN